MEAMQVRRILVSSSILSASSSSIILHFISSLIEGNAFFDKFFQNFGRAFEIYALRSVPTLMTLEQTETSDTRGIIICSEYVFIIYNIFAQIPSDELWIKVNVRISLRFIVQNWTT